MCSVGSCSLLPNTEDRVVAKTYGVTDSQSLSANKGVLIKGFSLLQFVCTNNEDASNHSLV